MRKLAVGLFLILNSSLSFSQDFYDLQTINTIEINFFDSNWDQILDTYYANDIGERLVATVVINGVQYDSCGVKYKGNSSYDINRTKNPFNIKLDYIKGNQDVDGYETLKLSNIWRDPSCVREVLAYEIARKYTTAPQANFANIYVDGALYGLYTSVENINKDFVKKHYWEDNGAFFKGEQIQGPPTAGCPGFPPPTSAPIWGYLNNDTTCYEKYYELESDYGYKEIMNMLDTFNNYTNSIEEVLNIDRHIWSIAYSNTFASLDSPLNIAHNYYIYQDVNHRFNHILWDENLSFGTFGLGSAPSTLLGTQQLDPYFNNNSDFPIISNVLQNATYTNMYFAHMRTMLNENIANGLYIDRIDTFQTLIDADIQADPNKFYTYSDFLNNVNSTVSGLYGIVELMDARNTYLLSLPEFTATTPTISNITTPSSIPQSSTITITADITNTSYVYLGTRDREIDRFLKTQMFDDGAHNDGIAGDGVYGVSINVSLSDIQYYIYAENTNAGIFSPERAEYEFHTLSVEKGLVINEIMASNSTTMADQDGEFDDWIELYNNSSIPVVLDGYSLTDNAANITKWSFPVGTTIGANDYLIIWADEDVNQAGLHSSFKLSASGESLILSNNSLSVVDELSFGNQTTDVGFGRYPNGIGTFTNLNPTFNAFNGNPITIDEIEKAVHFNIYPNPSENWFIIESDSDEDIIYNIYNTIGQPVLSGVMESRSKTINIKNWTSGLYFIRFENGKTVKLLVN
jgi:CotH kinase protein/Lamin Tail Domain/Secretion system C-terminal sorting domain